MKAITVRYLGPTNTRGARLKASDRDGSSITVSYDHGLNRDELYDSAALALCAKMGWTGNLARGWLKRDAVYVFIHDQDTITAGA